MAQNINKKTKSRRAQGSCLNAESNDFFRGFVCGDLANHPEVRHLVKLKEDRDGYFLRFNDVDKITSIYCDFKQGNGKILNRDLKKRKDNFKKIIKKQYEELGKLEIVGHGTERCKEYLKYEIKDSELRHSLTTKYSVQRKPDMQRHFTVMRGESSSDTGRGVSQSDDPSLPIETRENFYGSVNELSSDTGGVSQSDDPSLPIEDLEGLELLFDQVLNEQPNSGVSQPKGQLVGEHVFPESGLSPDELLNHLEKTADVSRSDDSTFDLQINPSTSENEASQQPLGAANKRILTMVPDKCPIKGGNTFMVRSGKPVPNGTYDVKIGKYGSCEASGSGNEFLFGLESIPPATRRGTHSVEVQIFDKATNILIGNTELEYVDNEATELKDAMQVKNPSLSKDGSDPHNERHRPTRKSSSDSIDGAGSNKRFKNCPIDMPLLVYLCDEMAKSGDKHFFSALIKFGIMGKVLENRCEYFKDFAITAQEHGHSELAKTIETSSRDVSDQLTETLTFGMLLDAVQTERSLENSDSVYSSDSDDDPNSCSSGYNGDCDSEDDQLSTKEDNTDVVHGDCSSECDDDSSGVTYTQENSVGQNASSSQAQDSNVHIMRIQENSAGHKESSSQIREMATRPFTKEELNFLKCASIVHDEFPKMLRHTFETIWNNKIAPTLPGYQVWDDSPAVRNLQIREGGKTDIPTNKSFKEWDCTALFKARTIYSKTFGVTTSTVTKTLSEQYLKGKKPNPFHSSVVSLALAIDQLRLLRNQLCHISGASVSKTDFDQFVLLAKDTYTYAFTLLIDDIGNLGEEDFPTRKVNELNERMKVGLREYNKFPQDEVIQWMFDHQENERLYWEQILQRLDKDDQEFGQMTKGFAMGGLSSGLIYRRGGDLLFNIGSESVRMVRDVGITAAVTLGGLYEACKVFVGELTEGLLGDRMDQEIRKIEQG